MKIANNLDMLTIFAKKTLLQMNKEQLNYSLFLVYILLFINWFDTISDLSLWPSGSVAGSHVVYIPIFTTSCS